MRAMLLALGCALALVSAVARADEQFSLVSPQWLADHSGDTSVLILDVRAEPGDYFAGHVPNAVNMADTTMRGPKEGVPVQFLPVAQQADLLARAGVRDGQTVVVYSDGQAVVGAAMVAYVLEKLGHPDVKLLDGGWSDYKAYQQVSRKYPAYAAGSLTPREQRTYATLDEVKTAISDDVILIDARPEKAYTGESDSWMRNGHIPGALNIDWHLLTQADNPHKLKGLGEMQAVFDEKNVSKTDDIIVYCGTGREATLEYAVLKHLLGYPKVRLYEGSWTEYSAHPELPVATGRRP